MVDHTQKKRNLLGVTEAAQVLRCSDQTVRNLCSRGDLPFSVVSATGARAIPVEAVEALARMRGLRR